MSKVCNPNRTSQPTIEYCSCRLQCHAFTAEINNQTILFQVIKMLDSIFLWIGYADHPRFEDLCLAMKNNYSKSPLAANILGDKTDLMSKDVAIRLCKKLNKAVYISLNIIMDKHVRSQLHPIEKRLYEEIENNCEKF